METEDQIVPRRWWTEKRTVLAEVLMFSIAVTIITLVFDRNVYVETVVTVVYALGLGVGILAWCRIDALERENMLSRHFSYAVIVFGNLSLIYYLFRTRGFLKGLAGVGYFVLFLIVMFAVDLVVMIPVLIVMTAFAPHPELPPAPPPASR